MREVGPHPRPDLGRETVDKLLDRALAVIPLVAFEGPGHGSLISQLIFQGKLLLTELANCHVQMPQEPEHRTVP
jgi:hypothetical protein